VVVSFVVVSNADGFTLTGSVVKKRFLSVVDAIAIVSFVVIDGVIVAVVIVVVVVVEAGMKLLEPFVGNFCVN
jgi:hypothetical protein